MAHLCRLLLDTVFASYSCGGKNEPPEHIAVMDFTCISFLSFPAAEHIAINRPVKRAV